MHTHPNTAHYWRRQGLPRHGAGNDHVLTSLKVALSAAKALAEQGHTLLNVAIGERNPRIEIAPCRACADLHGVEYITAHGPAGCAHHHAALLHGAQVTWIEKG